MPDKILVDSQIPLDLNKARLGGDNQEVLIDGGSSPTSKNDLFKTFFCKNFEKILKINTSAALNLDKEIVDPLVLELAPFLNLEKIQ